MFNLRMLKNSDFLLWISGAILVILGLFLIYSSTFVMQLKGGGNPFLFVERQVFSLLIGLLGLVFFAYLDYDHLKSLALPLYVFTLLLLAFVLFFALEMKGAQRWLQIGFFSFQPSEFAKISLIIILAKFFENRRQYYDSISKMLGPFLIAVLPFVLIFKQPDLGTALVLISILFGMLVFSEANLGVLGMLLSPLFSIMFSQNIFFWLFYMLVLISILYFSRVKLFDFIFTTSVNLIVGLSTPVIWGMLKAYQRQRILIFLNPEIDPLGAGYHTLQAKIAVGAGGILGRGFLHGTQTQLQFIPKQWMDFIFSVVAEEFGLIGSLLVLSLFAVLIWRAIVIAINARDFFGTLLAGGIATMYAFHLFVNVGMTLGIVPVVGVPLPLLAYGGTSLLMNMISIGILQSISMRRTKLLF